VKQTVSLGDQIRSSVDFALTGSNVRCEIHIDDDLPAASADVGQINQVIHNLLINAVEAMPGGGLITLRAERALLGKYSPLPLPPGLYIRVSVQDRGTGVPREKMSKIFDPYFTTKKRGSGLGLATCYSIIRNHGGYINVESGQGTGGALFYFYLPASLSPVPETRIPAQDEVLSGKGSILLMDDEKFVREVAGRMLERLGYRVEFAADGADAIDQYRKAQESGREFDAVILDLTVPGGMGGKDAIQKIREIDPKVKAIVSSGYSENRVMSEYKQYGFCGVLPKPYNVQVMSRALQSVINQTHHQALPMSGNEENR
jgi:CheY-like chemotaxis protein